MDFVSYKYTRERLIDLWHELSYEGFRMMVPPHMFMTTKEIENHEHVTYENSYDMGGEIHQQRPYLVTVPHLSRLIKGMNKESRIGFFDAGDSITLFKKITEYLDLWMDIANDCPQYFIPHLDELYELEEVALWIFHTYRPAMITRMNIRMRKQQRDAEHEPKGQNPFLLLLRMGATESVDEIPEDISFISVLDARLPERLSTYYQATKKAKPSLSLEEEWKINMSDIADLIG
ncbi:hypothetical protein [Vibrio phage VP4B]|uniref:Uncharacterized protein n=1 Tax=Vibrio phage VP4B TaxID=1262540 RepID=V9LZF3_9CAUD|nr:hypothetical protein FDJ61_gp128 [Vibrio phage VP4B]AGB07242.1 hypothetical protein [Vibrio phage VP4B]